MADQAKPLTLRDLAVQIEARSALPKDTELPRPNHYSWWHPEFKKYVVFKLEQPFPWRDTLMVFACFRDADELRVYTVPAQGPDGKPKELEKDEWPLRRWVLSKRNMGTFECEDLTVEVFVQSIADEWAIVAEGMKTAERERVQIVEFLLTVEGTTCAEAAALIQEGIHTAPADPEELEAPAPEAPSLQNGAGAAPSPDAGSSS
jgi:hypothetical protein